MNITFVTENNFVTKFDNAKHLIAEATPNGDSTILQKEWQRFLKEKRAIILTAEVDDNVIGILMGVLDFNSCTKEKILTECHWYVLKDYRQIAGGLLYKKLIEYAEREYCDAVVFNSAPENRHLIEFLVDKNFKAVNISYKKEI